MKEILGVCILSIVSVALLVWILAIGFQTRSLVDVFGAPFGDLNSAYDIILTYVFPMLLVLGFAVIAFSLLRIFD